MLDWKCCVPGCCYVPGTVRHRFPVYEERLFREWVNRIGNVKLDGVDDMTIYKNYFVCDKHFSDDCRSPGTKRLNRLSAPTLHLKNFIVDAYLSCGDLSSVDASVSPQVQVTEGTATEDKLSSEAEDTADLLLLMDKMFDSMNGSSFLPKKGKTLRCAVTRQSEHFKFWDEAIKILSTMKFVDPVTRSFSVPPTLKNWILTLKNFRYLSLKLLDVGFKFICPRNFNQDPVENFFSCIRSQGAQNNNPTSSSFAASFRSLIITNFMSSHSASSNCEDDKADGALDTLQDFVFGNVPEPVTDDTNQHNTDDYKSQLASNSSEVIVHQHVPQSKMSGAAAVYVHGYFARKIYRATKSCETCRNELISTTETENCDFVTARQYSPKALCYPNTNFSIICNKIVSIVRNLLPLLCHKPNIMHHLKTYVFENVDFSSLTCVTDNVKDLTVNVLLKVMIFAWVKQINRIILGKQKVHCTNDPIKIQAQKYFSTHQKRRSKK